MSAASPKVIDCTIRDGGLVNNWDFSIEFVNLLYEALNQSGIEYMEIGYKNAPGAVPQDGTGPWRLCDESLIREAIPEKKITKLSVMVDVGKFDHRDISIHSESQIDLIRVACYISQIDEAIVAVNALHEKGYETCLNIMAVSSLDVEQLNPMLQKVRQSFVDKVYIVDSFGSLYMDDVRRLTALYKKFLPDKQIGIHAHNNLQLAFANTITAEQAGCTFLDSTVYGMGRAAGNCPTELLVGYLEPNYDVKPLLKTIEELFMPLRKLEEWGYLIPFAITGQLNEHPRSAIAMRNHKETKDQYLDFYEKTTARYEKDYHAVR